MFQVMKKKPSTLLVYLSFPKQHRYYFKLVEYGYISIFVRDVSHFEHLTIIK